MSGESRGADSGLVAVLATLMVLLLSAGWLLAGVLVDDDLPPLTVAGGRTLVCCLVLTGIAAARRRYRIEVAAATRRRKAVLGLAVLGFLLYYTGTMLGIAVVGASRTGLVVSLLPCITFVIGVAAFGERASPVTVAGTVLAVLAAVGYGLDSSAARGALPVPELLGGLALGFAGTVAYAVYGYVYRRTMPDLRPLAALPAITGVSVVLLAPGALLSLRSVGITGSDLVGLALLGGVLTAPVFLLSHELILRRGPLFTSAVALLVPFLVRLGEWAVGQAGPPGPVPILLLAMCAAGVWMTVTGRATGERAAEPTAEPAAEVAETTVGEEPAAPDAVGRGRPA